LRIIGEALGSSWSIAARFWGLGTAGLANTVRALGICRTRANSWSVLSQASKSPVALATSKAAAA